MFRRESGREKKEKAAEAAKTKASSKGSASKKTEAPKKAHSSKKVGTKESIASEIPERPKKVTKHTSTTKSKKTPAAATSAAAVPTIKLKGKRFNIKFAARHVYFADVKVVLELEEAREKRFLQAAKKQTLVTSFMTGGDKSGSTAADAAGGDPLVEEFKISFMNVLNIPAFGNFSRMWIDVYFGKDPRSAPIQLIVDTGSSLIWVNEVDYKAAIAETGVKEGKYQSGKIMKQSYTAGDVVAQVYKDSISFFPPNAKDKDNVYIKNQLFGVADDKSTPKAKRWRDKNMRGIFGIGPRSLNKKKIESNDEEDHETPTIVDNMKDQGLISEHVIGIYFKLPNEGEMPPFYTSNVDSSSDVGTVKGELHFGAPKKSLFNMQSLREIKAIKRGLLKNYYGIVLKLSYNGETIMDASPGIIDTGSQFTSLPESVLDKYLLAIQKASERPAEKPVVTYDETRRLYCMAKADFGLLKELEFDFVKGLDAVFKFSPSQQVSPPLLTKHWSKDANSDELFLPFKKLRTAHEGRQFILGMTWSKGSFFI